MKGENASSGKMEPEQDNNPAGKTNHHLKDEADGVTALSARDPYHFSFFL